MVKIRLVAPAHDVALLLAATLVVGFALVAAFAGHPTEVHPHSLAAIDKQLAVDVDGQSDILIAGISNVECYSKFSVMNPILLANSAMAGTVMQFQGAPVVREGGIAILVHPRTERFDSRRFAPHVEDFAHHGAHSFFMWNSTGVPRRYLSKIYFVGVTDFDAAARCGFEAFATVEEAIEAAEAELGMAAEITLLQRPPHFIPRASAG